MEIETGSFRDPSGIVFMKEGKIYRSIFAWGVKDYEAAREAGVYNQLIGKGLLLSHKEIVNAHWAPEGTKYCLEHPRLPFVSYPWEWTFTMLKDAAILHLDAMETLLPQQFWLRDASAFNVQYDGRQLRLIDTLSIGQRVPNSPWVAYRQFCEHFMAPLALAAYVDIRTLSLWRNYIDGYPLDLAVKMLPIWRRYVPGIFIHLALHARFQNTADRKEDLGKQNTTKTAKVSDPALIGIIRSLRRAIEHIRWTCSSQIWDTYEHIRTYQAEDVATKSEYVNTIVQRLKPGMVWDLGANIGEFSFIAASAGAFVVSIEGDPACAEHLYQRIAQKKRSKNILPLTMNLANPSPGLGWDSCERLGLKERGPAALLLALALIHHLVLYSGIPLAHIAKWFSDLCQAVVVEWIPESDPMVQKLVSNRRGEHLPYNHDLFQTSFGEYFRFEHHVCLTNGRILYLCQRLK